MRVHEALLLGSSTNTRFIQIAMADTSTFGFKALWSNFYVIGLMSCVLLLSLLYLLSRRSTKYPPICKGWIPWLGCAIEFGKRPLDFIDHKRKQVGRSIIFHLFFLCFCFFLCNRISNKKKLTACIFDNCRR